MYYGGPMEIIRFVLLQICARNIPYSAKSGNISKRSHISELHISELL